MAGKRIVRTVMVAGACAVALLSSGAAPAATAEPGDDVPPSAIDAPAANQTRVDGDGNSRGFIKRYADVRNFYVFVCLISGARNAPYHHCSAVG